jgi:hypothetical protein
MVSSVAKKWRYIWLLKIIGVGATNVRDCILLAVRPPEESVLGAENTVVVETIN